MEPGLGTWQWWILTHWNSLRGIRADYADIFLVCDYSKLIQWFHKPGNKTKQQPLPLSFREAGAFISLVQGGICDKLWQKEIFCFSFWLLGWFLQEKTFYQLLSKWAMQDKRLRKQTSGRGRLFFQGWSGWDYYIDVIISLSSFFFTSWLVNLT